MSGYTYDLYEKGNLENKLTINVTEAPQGNKLYVKNGASTSFYAYRGLAPDNKTFRFELMETVETPVPSANWDEAFGRLTNGMQDVASKLGGYLIEALLTYTSWKSEMTYSVYIDEADADYTPRAATPFEIAMWRRLQQTVQGQ